MVHGNPASLLQVLGPKRLQTTKRKEESITVCSCYHAITLDDDATVQQIKYSE